MPKLLKAADPAELAGIRGVCLDIDDTLSSAGKLTDEAYAALWSLKRAGFAVVPVTGRPAGWCDHIARFWPVDAVVGENGAFIFHMKDGVRRRIDLLGDGEAAAAKTKLGELSASVLRRFPDAKWASDQSYREYDLAIDVCEDVPAWERNEVDALLALCHGVGAHAKLSSIHVNAWFGDYDKKSGFRRWLSSGMDASMPPEREWLYIGDSPNDEPMFEAFPSSVGVANLARYLDRLTHKPRWLTSSESGAGFAEMARALIAARGKG
jgi:hypothetical protein